jgi:hypothetical protein
VAELNVTVNVIIAIVVCQVPEGNLHPFLAVGDDNQKEPFGLAPDDQSIALLDELYAQLLPCFSSRQFNVGTLTDTAQPVHWRTRVQFCLMELMSHWALCVCVCVYAKDATRRSIWVKGGRSSCVRRRACKRFVVTRLSIVMDECPDGMWSSVS